MKHIVIVTHSELSEAYKKAAAMIAGEKALKNIKCFCMTELKSVEEFLVEIEQYLEKKHGDEFLILADIYGASPCNTSLMGFCKENYRIVTGVNLGMLLEAICQLDNSSLMDLADYLVNVGKEGIKDVYLPYNF